MTTIHRAARRGAATLLLVVLGACSSGSGGLGEILGSVLGGGQGQAAQVAGTIKGVDTQNQQIGLQQSNGQTVGIGYDGNTKVVYQNQLYAVTNLESGDQVNLRVLDKGNGNYYTDSITVTQSVSPSGSSGTSTSGNVQSLQGTVRQIDRANGLFTIDVGSGSILTVSMPYNPRTADATAFQNLRTGNQVRFYGVFLNNSRVELRQFY